MTYPSEVLIYVQKVKTYLESNMEAMKYFLGDGDLGEFLKTITDISLENFEKNREPELTIDQFESVRGKNMFGDVSLQTTFISYGDFGLFSLN